ncbi:MAG: DUF1353 domain-containing protein [Hyphomonas sp.]|nr:DUF1353 domain-containing protein [Hyphomonas sp.]
MSDIFFRRSSFKTPLKYEPAGTTRKGIPEYRLLESFSFEIGGFGSETFITVPQFFVTDLASIPKGVRWMLPPNGPYAKAAVIHDYMYEFASVFRWDRSYADLVFREGMERLDVPAHIRTIMYRSVRTFGNRNFDKVSEANRFLLTHS